MLFVSRNALHRALLPVCLVLAAAQPCRSAENGNAVRFAGANGELVVDEVSERTARIRFIPQSASNDTNPPSTILVPFESRERFRSRAIDGTREITVGNLRVSVSSQPLTVAVRRADGKEVQRLVFDAAEGTNSAVSFKTESVVLGLGEGAQQFDRRGAFYPMEPSWGAWNRPVLGSVVPSPFVIGTEGWALFAHLPEGHFDLRDGKGRFIPKAGQYDRGLDLFVIDLREPADALAEYTRLTGRPVMPPKWALGYMQSHRTLSGPEEPLEIARTFREKNLPCDAVIYLGTGYCTNGWNTGHGSLEFNENAFVAGNIKELHDLHFKVVLHVNRAPRILFGNLSDPPGSRGSAGQQEGGRGRRGGPVHVADYWARHQDLIKLGVDGWWPDDGDELLLESRLTRHRAYYEGPLLDRPNVRPWSLHRTGYAGSQRYGGWIWSGDIDGRWATLAAQVSVGLNHGLSLTPFWGTDTGGFYPSRELTGELYLRWLQFSAFCPSFRSHGRTWHLRLPWGWNTGEFGVIEHGPAERRDFAGDIKNPPQHPNPSELRNPQVEPIARKYMELRYRLLPYNYTLAREAVDTGLPMMRAMWLHYSNDPEAAQLGNQYLWGRELLVAPVVEAGLKVRRVYLPEGNWVDWWTGQTVQGKRWVERAVDLETIPVYARAGAIIPLDPVRQYTSQQVSDPTTLRVHPGANGTFTLYDDDGQSLGYRDGSDPKTTWIRFQWDNAARRLTVERDPRMKQWTGGTRVFLVETAGGKGEPKRIEFRGERASVEL